MEPLPDLASLPDAELRQLIKDLVKEEHEVSYRRRMLHGKIDILRAELVARLQKAGGGAYEDDVELDKKLAAILASKSAPPSENELE